MASNNVIGVMVICTECRRVVWAQPRAYGDLRGILNMLGLPCRLCGAPRSFDQFDILDDGTRRLDAWGRMHEIADAEGLAWAIPAGTDWYSPLAVVALRSAIQVEAKAASMQVRRPLKGSTP